MKKIKITLPIAMAVVIFGCVVGIFFSITGKKTNVTDKYSDEVAQVHGQFAAKTAEEVLKSDKKNNICFSPCSYYGMLSLLTECTAGETRQEILDSIGLKDLEESRVYNKDFFEKVNIGKQYDFHDKSKLLTEINVSNSIWLNNIAETMVNADTVNFCKENYKVDYYNDKILEENIDKWAFEKTNGLIDDIVNKDVESAEAVFVNALYFKGTWVEKLKNYLQILFILKMVMM